MSALYNEIDRAAVAALHEVMADGLIAPGRIESRSIKELTADDIRGHTQCHFFAGAGSWSYAARLAGWRDEWPIWTASCPCQPFSQAGKGAGFADERHLWPDILRLIDELEPGFRPAIIVGEQVAGAAGYAWFERVRTDLGARGYETWVVNIPAAAVDAPHIRQRLYWIAIRGDVANTNGCGRAARQEAPQRGEVERAAVKWADDVEHAASIGRGEGWAEHELRSGRATAASADASGVTLGYSFQSRLEGQSGDGDGAQGRSIKARSVAEADGGHMGHTASDGRPQGQGAAPIARHGDQPAAAHGRNGSFWSDHEWLICHDGKARRTQPGLRLLVNGAAGRVHQWRIAGNGIVAPLAAEVIGALIDVLSTTHLTASERSEG